MISSQLIRDAMKVIPEIDVEREVKRRIDFISHKLVDSGLKVLVLGISGGIDSAVCGALAQRAVDELNADSDRNGYEFVAVRLPYDVQADEDDAMMVIDFIGASKKLAINIQSGTDAIHNSVVSSFYYAGVPGKDVHALDFAKGNVKARMRMIAQYEVAGVMGGLVLGTDHSAEAVLAYFTKFGDGAVDLAPLFGLNKRQVKQMARYLGIPEKIINKTSTADLETLNPQVSDEEAIGLTYDQIDDFLEGKPVGSEVEEKIINIYEQTRHKREPIPTIY